MLTRALRQRQDREMRTGPAVSRLDVENDKCGDAAAHQHERNQSEDRKAVGSNHRSCQECIARCQMQTVRRVCRTNPTEDRLARASGFAAVQLISKHSRPSAQAINAHIYSPMIHLGM